MASTSDQVEPFSNNQHGQPPIINAQYKFNEDELRVLKECNRDSFFQRSLPIGTGLSLATYFGVQAGYIKGHMRWGSTPKVIIAATVGYFVGKFSYQSKCAEKIMQLDNSPLADMLRKRKQLCKGGFSETMDPMFGAANVPPFTGLGPQDVYSDVGPRHDLESGRPYIAGLNENNKPTPDSTFEDALPVLPPSHTTTYDELRRRNREEYERRQKSEGRHNLDRIPTTPSQLPLKREAGPPVDWNKEKNKYGDTWDED